ncbi:MAG TPA: 4Fe-4S binding protein [Burkholderiales bacterium]|nr:4Fe-4S binding protein [Burkholderiales bacterium]
MRHLGALGFLLFWMLAASGIYLYVRFDTSAAGAYDSIGELEWWFGGVLRSVHRYAADAFVVVTVLHLLREAWLGRWRGFRAFTWISGIPLLWLLYASGVIGYWLVWDARSQFSFRATMEWMGLAARVGEAPDRLFSLFVFLHIGLPLALLAGMWVHVQRLGQPKTVPPRALTWGCAALLLATAALRPAVSEPQWDSARAARDVALDWFYQFIHALMYATSPAVLWVLVLGISALLLLLPYFSRKEQIVAAQVDPANCNACGRCVADCPYEAIILSENKASVFASRCAACGICAGACPSSTPFRSIRHLVSGIELPDQTMQELRGKVQAVLASGSRELVFACQTRANPGVIALRCLAMLPPSVVEYALRRGARGVRAVGCEGECAYRLGMELCEERFAGRREPHLRATVNVQRNNNEYRFVLAR